MMNNNARIYFVIDMKSFFASVECVERGLDPQTAKLVVADKRRTEKTICLAVTQMMKKLGVKNRCRLFDIPKNIDYIIAKPRMQKYIDYAAKIYSIYLDYLSPDEIHVYSIDECFLDVSRHLKMNKMRAKAFYLELRRRISSEIGIPCTCGIGSNMYLAKIALDITAKNSPDGIGWLNEEKYINSLSNHRPLTDFWRISSGTSRRLEKYGIYDMEGIRKCDEDILYKEFGIDAELLIDHAYGIETCQMEHIKKYVSKEKSISTSEILPSPYKYDDAKIVMKEIVQTCCYELAKNHYVTNLINISVGYNEKEYKSTHFSIRLNVRTNLFNYMVEDIERSFDKNVNKDRLIRRIGCSFNELLPDNYEQYDLFTNPQEVEKEKNLRDCVIKIKDKFGKNSVLKGVDYEENATQRERNKLIGGHNADDE